MSPQSRTLRVPITVTLSTATASRNITRSVGDVRFRHTIPGGFASCTVDLNRAFADYSEELAQYARLRFTDGRNGSVLWEGRLEDPGRTASAQGQVWSLTAYGPQAHAKDIEAPYVAADKDLSRWVRGYGTQTYVTDAQEDSQDPSVAGRLLGPLIRFSASDGTVIGPTSILARYYYPCFLESGQRVGTILGSARVGPMTGPLASEHRCRVQLTDDTTMTGGMEQATDFTALAFPQSFSLRKGVDWVGNDKPVPVLEWRYINQSNTFVAGSVTWALFGDRLTVRPIMHRADGSEIPTTNGAEVDPEYAAASEIVADLLGGGRLPRFDGAGASIAPTSRTTINQFAYPDPVTADQLLTDLMVVEPLYYWAAWESNAARKARFEWALWPGEVKHIIAMVDGCDLPTSTAEMYNAVSVRWKDSLGRIRRTRRVSVVPQLDGAGLIRESALDLGDNVSSQEAAVSAGDGFLADHAYPRGTGTLTVAREVMDRQTGRMLAPWELRPGCLVQIRGADPSAYSQGASARNGRNVFRVIAVEFDSSTGAATLELDSPPNSIWDQIGAANRDLVTRRRR